MYEFPSTSRIFDPWPLAMKMGVPPTALNALTGLLTPPTITLRALS